MGWLSRANAYSKYCIWNDTIYVNPHGVYELQLCYKSAPQPSSTSPTIEERRIRVNGSSRRLAFEDLASIPDAEWLTNFDRAVYNLYPQSIALRDTLQSLINGKPIFQVSTRDGFNVTLRNRAGKKLMTHSQFPVRTERMLLREMYAYDDLLVGDYEDSYYNLSLKLFHTFQWAARFCRPHKPIFVFIDDDYAVNTERLVNFVRNLTPESRDKLSHGHDMRVNPVFRYASKHPQWAFSKREIPWPMHTPELLGIYSVWSYRHVHDMALAMHFTKPMVIDDTWLAMVQYKLQLTFTRLPGMLFLPSPQSKKLNCSGIFFALIDEFKRHKCAL